MMSALQRIVLVAAILTIMTAVTVESQFICYSDLNCQNVIGICKLFGVRACVVNTRCIHKFETNKIPQVLVPVLY